MHRSGTSAITQAIHALGIPLGRADDLFSAPDNPSGHFESNQLCLVNDFILARFGGTWWAPPKLARNWHLSRRANSLLPYLRTALSDVYRTDYWLWKDPRLSYTMPLWSRVLPPVCAVVVVRNPASVALSLHKRDHFPLTYCHALWNAYNRSAARAVSGLPSIFVNFDDALRDPARSLERLADHLSCLGVRIEGSHSEAAGCLLPEGAKRPISWLAQINEPLWRQLSIAAPVSSYRYTPSSIARPSLWAGTALALGRLWARRPDAPSLPALDPVPQAETQAPTELTRVRSSGTGSDATSLHFLD